MNTADIRGYASGGLFRTRFLPVKNKKVGATNLAHIYTRHTIQPREHSRGGGLDGSSHESSLGRERALVRRQLECQRQFRREPERLERRQLRVLSKLFYFSRYRREFLFSRNFFQPASSLPTTSNSFDKKAYVFSLRYPFSHDI